MCGHATALKSFTFGFVFGTHLLFFNQINPLKFISLGNHKLLFKPIICGTGSDIRVDHIITTTLSSRTGFKLYNPGHKGFLDGVTCITRFISPYICSIQLYFYFQILILLYNNRLDTDDVSVHIYKLLFLFENLNLIHFGSPFS